MDTAAEVTRRKVETLRDALNDERSRAEAAAILRGPIDDLAGILALAAGRTSKKPRVCGA
jgi:hypothetical protein